MNGAPGPTSMHEVGRAPEAAPDRQPRSWGDGPEPAIVAGVSEADLLDGSALSDLLEEVRRHRPEGAAVQAELATIERAYGAASRAHAEQRRKSGEPYLVHPVRVARILAGLGLDQESIVAGLLHDAVEDSELTVFDVGEQFGREVSKIVDGVTKLGKVPYLSRQEQQAESFRKMLLAMSEDIRVLVVKLIDRLDNMRTLEHMPRDKQERISRETMQIYAPLAGRLGLEWIRRELQDLSFRFLEPAAYFTTQHQIQALLARDPGAIEETLGMLRRAFEVDRVAPSPDDEMVRWSTEALGPVRVRATMRPSFRVHRRLEAAERSVDQLSDIVTFQIVTRDRAACYAALGHLHAHFQPVPGRFRDYVALPRPNHYRALHTSVIDREGRRIEVQIRSERMDAVAERGIVAERQHARDQGREQGRLAWLGQLMDWQEEVKDPNEFIEAVKADLFADEVYVFSPKGDIYTFQKGATPIDFAFAIHTDVGMQCSGARVNGHVVPLRYRLRQGDTVEILTNPQVGPREEWLKMCVSSRARAKIKYYLRQRERERLRSLGRSLVEQEVTTRGADLADYEARGSVADKAEALGVSRERGADGVYEAVGAGQITAAAVADALGAEHRERDEAQRSLVTRLLRRMTGRNGRGEALGGHPTRPIVVTRERVEGRAGGEGLIALATCCSPVPGDPLVGFFAPGKGIVVHVEGCPEALEQVSERRVHVAWEADLTLECPVTLEVRTANTVGLLAEMSRAFSAHGVNIKQANCRTYGDGERAINTFQATVHSLSQLQALIDTLRGIEGVIAVQRVFTPTGALLPAR